jgi:ankyrin repeat protein
VDERGRTPLATACIHGRCAVVDLLLSFDLKKRIFAEAAPDSVVAQRLSVSLKRRLRSIAHSVSEPRAEALRLALDMPKYVPQDEASRTRLAVMYM